MAVLSHRAPPSPDRIDRKAGSIVVRADADPAEIVRDVIDAVRNGAAQLGINEIMNIDQLGPVFWAPFATVILEITHQFLLFRINRNDGFIRSQERLRLRIDVLELGVTVDVPGSFARLAVGLQAVAHDAQEITYNVCGHLLPFFASSVTRLRKLRLVHNSGRMGSPRLAGATSLLRSNTRFGSSVVFLLRPPPSWRTRPAGADTLSRISDSPR